MRLIVPFIFAILVANSEIMRSVAYAADVSFRNDVMGVLSKAGCNMGVCHGNANGKGGFKLSLRGQDPDADFLTLTRQLTARRTNVIDPADSLLLIMPTMQVPHPGGKRFATDSMEYCIILDWIAAGTPADSADRERLVELQVKPSERILVAPENAVQLQATANFSDGSTRDVTRLAVYEPSQPIVEIDRNGYVTGLQPGETSVTVRYLDQQVAVRLAFVPERPNFVWRAPDPANIVDECVFEKLRSVRVNPSGLCSDTVFLRRAYLDLLGMLPPVDIARAFVADDRIEKRAELIDQLLDHPQFADFQALHWADLLRVEEKTLDRKGVENYYAWIRSSIAHGKPFNEFARELIAARGSTYENAPANYYRAMRDPVTRAESTAQVFLGIRLQCAKCHNHPFDRWTQDDYYGWANLFARVDYRVLANDRVDSLDKHEFVGEQIVFMADKGDVNNARTGKPSTPKFLGDSHTTFRNDQDRLLQLADWLANPDNERFAATQVNRVWAQLFGRGIVDPVDDFRATNPASNPRLLDTLARDFVASDFDLRHVIRTIMKSRTYQQSSRPNATNRDDEINFSHVEVRRLTAEQLADAISDVCGVPIPFAGFPAGLRAVQLPGVRGFHPRKGKPLLGDRFLTQFGKPERLQTCECERTDESTLDQTFELVSGELLNDLLLEQPNRITTLLASNIDNASRLSELYRVALSREPSAPELSAALTHLAEAKSRQHAFEDVVWALINSHEFMLRQ